MADNAELGFSVDTSQLDEATKALDRVTEAAGRTEQATISAGGAGRKMAHDYVPGVDATVEAIQRSERAANAYIQSLQKQLDMLGKNKAEQVALQAQYSGFSQQIQQQAYDIGKKIDAWHREEEAAKAAAKAEELAGRMAETSAKGFKGLSFATAGSTRELIVLAHEALTGNWSRMPGSVMVLMERVGGLHTALGALMSPLGLLGVSGAASVGALGYAMYQGAQEAKEFGDALAQTHNATGLTADQFEGMATRLSASLRVSRGDIRATTDEAIRTGRLSGDAVALMTEAATRYAKITGMDATEAVQKFARALEDPTKGAQSLNEQIHFLTVQQYEHIRAMQQAGDVQGAQMELMHGLNESLIPRSVEQVGALTDVWRGLGDVLGTVWEGMKRIGRQETLAEQAASIRAEIMGLQQMGHSSALYGSQADPNAAKKIKELEGKLASIQRAQSHESYDAAMQGIYAEQNAAAIAASAALDKKLAAHATMAEKRRKAHEEDARKLADMEAGGKTVTAQLRQQVWDATEAEYKDPKHGRTEGEKVQAWYEREFARLQEDIGKYKNRLQNLQNGDAKQVGEMQQRIMDMLKYDPTGKKAGVSSSTASKLMDLAKQDDDGRRAAEMYQAKQRQDHAVQKFANDTGVKWQVEADKALDILWQERDLIGASTEARKVYAAQLKIEAELRTAIVEAANKANMSEAAFRQAYPQIINQMQQANDIRLRQEIPAIRESYQLSQQWSTGWANAWTSYQESASNNATMAAGVFNSMTRGMETALTGFFESSKLGWRSFTVAILQEIEKIMVAKMAAGLLTQAAGFVTSMVPTQSAAPIEAGTPSWTAQAKGGAWIGGMQYYANGGVFDQPTMFQHAGGLGVLGEAGPEAVMPLQRDSNGRLGVKAQGGGGGGDVIINMTNNFVGDKQQSSSSSNAQVASMMAALVEPMKAIAKKVIADEMRQGGALYKARQA